MPEKPKKKSILAVEIEQSHGWKDWAEVVKEAQKDVERQKQRSLEEEAASEDRQQRKQRR